MPERKLTLSQVVGNLSQAREANNRAGTALRNGLKEQHVTGTRRTFTARDDELARLQHNPDTYTAVALRVMDQLRQDSAHSVTALDWALTQDTTNCVAKADVFWHGEVLLSQVPVSTLLHYAKFFAEYKEVVLAKLPILDPTKDWDRHPNRQDIWVAPPEVTQAFIKRNEPVMLHPGTDKHAPQAVLDMRETHIGHWTTQVSSGAIREDDKRRLLANADTLIAAFKDAIARANHTPAEKQAAGEKLFGVLLDLN